jgi:long-chain acyl-CoA synthetase
MVMADKPEQACNEKGDTWPKILRYNSEKYGDTQKAMRYKHYGIWRPFTWKDYYLHVKYLALGLLSLGFEPGDKLLIIGDNAPQWYHAELAAQANHGVSVGLYADSTSREVEYIARNSEARFAVVEDQEQVDKLLEIRGELPLLKEIIHWNYKGLAHYNDPFLMGFEKVLQLGKRYEEEHPGVFEQNLETGKADDICAIVYTSGTTGDSPKGAVHTYRTLKTGADYHLYLDPWDKHDNIVPSLPPAWITEQWLGIGCHLLSGSILNFAEAPETQQRDVREVRPNIVFHGARTWEAKAAMVQARVLGADVIKRFTFRVLMPIGYKMADRRLARERPGLFLKILYGLADLFLFGPMKDSLGLSRARICYNCGALLGPEVLRFYHALGLPLKSLYGTTEGGTLTGARNDDIRLETVGPAHNGAEVRISEGREIIYRQPGIFSGYYKNPGKTAEVLKDGWFHSGDCGFVRDDGHVVFLDRLNDLVEMASGDLLAPQFIESRLRFSPYISDAWVVTGPEKAYASAMIVINYNNVGRWAGQRRVAYSTFAQLSQQPEIFGLIKADIERVNRTLPPGLRVKKYLNLHKEFDPDEGEITRSRKLRRKFLEEHYAGLINAIYENRDAVQIETRVAHRDGRGETMKTTLSIHCVEGASL